MRRPEPGVPELSGGPPRVQGSEPIAARSLPVEETPNEQEQAYAAPEWFLPIATPGHRVEIPLPGEGLQRLVWVRVRRVAKCRAGRSLVGGPGSRTRLKWRAVMLWTILVVLLVLWLLGMITSYTMGGLLHILLVVAVVIVIIRLVSGRKVL